MSIIDNLKGVSSKKLYEALQYSGLVTENMSFDEICEVLANEYPEIYKLYMSRANEGEFVDFAGGISEYAKNSSFIPTINYGAALEIINNKTNWNQSNSIAVGSAMSKSINLTKYKKLRFYHISSVDAASTYNKATVFISESKTTSMQPQMSEILIQNQKYNSGLVELDISSLSGDFFIGIEVQVKNVSSNLVTRISEMWLE